MTISDEAVQAMPERIYAKTHGASTDVISGQRGLIGGWNEHKRDGQTEFVRADLALPFLQGVKVKALSWTQKAPPVHDHEPFVYWADGIGGHYRAERDGMLWYAHDAFHWKQFASQKEAKAAAQADYSARILSAIEVSEPAPSPRAQAFTEELVKQAMHETWNDICYDTGCHPLDIHRVKRGELMFIPDHWASATYERLRALSSKPVADRLPQDVINLVIAAREFWEVNYNDLPSSYALDKALEAFASRVLYENEPDPLPSAPGASE